MEELLKELLEETKAVEGETELLASLKKAKFSADESSTVQAAIRLLTGLEEKIKKSGIVVKAFETKKDPEPAKVDAKATAAFLKSAKAEDKALVCKELGIDAEALEGKKKPPTNGILKADGSLDVDQIPENLRPAMELLFKDRTDTASKLKKAEEDIAKNEQEKKHASWVKKAEEFKDLPGVNVEELATTLAKLDDEDAEKIMKQYRANKEVIEKSDFFKEFGRPNAGGGTGTAIEKVNTMAEGLIQKNDKLDQAAAIQQVLNANPALYNEYVKETQIRA